MHSSAIMPEVQGKIVLMSNTVTKETTYLNRYPVKRIDICCTSKQSLPQYCYKHDPYTRNEQINSLKREENHIQKLKGKTKTGAVLIISEALDVQNVCFLLVNSTHITHLMRPNGVMLKERDLLLLLAFTLEDPQHSGLIRASVHQELTWRRASTQSLRTTNKFTDERDKNTPI
jgi:hypothetical protein